MSRTIQLELESLEEEIASYEILITSASNNARYGAMLGAGKNPVANLEIPNKLFFLWAPKRSLQERLCTSVSKHFKLVNKSILGGTAEAKHALDLRLQKEASRLKSKYKKLRREAKLELENNKTNMLVYENEIHLVIIEDEAENESENVEFKLKGMISYS